MKIRNKNRIAKKISIDKRFLLKNIFLLILNFNRFNVFNKMLVIGIFSSLFIIFTSFVKSSDFNVMPTNIHFYGSVATSKNIIAYGDFGAYLLTTDNGNTWKQYSVNEYGIIQKIVNYNDTLWGIVDEGFLIRSTDEGLNWSKIKLNLGDGEHLVNLAVNDNYIYVRFLKGIHRFDKNFNILNSLTDTILKNRYIPFNNLTTFKPYISNQEMFYLNGKLIVNVYENYYDGFITISEDLTKIDYINLKNKINVWRPKGIPIFYKLLNIFKYNDKFVFDINQNLYITDNNFIKWSYFYPDSVFLNTNDPTFNIDWPYYDYIINTYYITNNNLYLNYCLPDNGKIMYPSSSPSRQGGGILGYFGLKKYEFDGLHSQFKPFNNKFDNKYYTPKYADLVGNGGPIASLYTSNNLIFQDSNIINVGLFKSVLQSKNNGKTWELVSCLNGIPKLIINDSSYYFINPNQNTNDIYRTNDYGNTFLPTELGLDTALFYNSHQDSAGAKIDTISVSIDTVSYFGKFDHTNIFFIDGSGRSFWGGPLSFITDYKYNCAFSNDGGKKYKFTYIKQLFLGSDSWPSITSNIELIDGKYIFSVSNPSRKWMEKYWNYIYIQDTSMNIPLNVKLDSLHVIYHILAENLKHFYLLASTQDTDNLYHIRFTVQETNDSGKTFKTINSINQEFTIDQIYEHNKDSVFFSTLHSSNLYLYDRKRNVIDTLYKGTDNDSLKIMFLSGRFYLLGNNVFLENTNRNDLSTWADAAWDFGRPSFQSVIFKGNVAIAKLYDSIRPLNYYRINLKKSTEVNENKTEVVYYTNHFYAYPPCPTPTINFVKTLVTWDMSFDLENSIRGICNIDGDLIERKENISFNYISKASAEIIWNCSEVNNGVYFIIVDHNGISDCIQILIKK